MDYGTQPATQAVPSPATQQSSEENEEARAECNPLLTQPLTQLFEMQHHDLSADNLDAKDDGLKTRQAEQLGVGSAIAQADAGMDTEMSARDQSPKQPKDTGIAPECGGVNFLDNGESNMDSSHAEKDERAIAGEESILNCQAGGQHSTDKMNGGVDEADGTTKDSNRPAVEQNLHPSDTSAKTDARNGTDRPVSSAHRGPEVQKVESQGSGTSSQSTAFRYWKTSVSNPYARQKRPSDQISRCSSVSSVTSTATQASKGQTNSGAASGPSPPRRPLNNPYAKKPSPKPVHNPYAKLKSSGSASSTSTRTPPYSIEMSKPASVTKNVEVASNRAMPVLEEVNETHNKAKRRRINMSISLPYADRLPSKQVSFQPAEILTVGELYRYMYEEPDGRQAPEKGILNGGAVALPGDMVSVRITGTLLCATAQGENDIKKGDSYKHGMYLLVGDPLESNRFAKEKISVAAVPPAAPKASLKPKLTSILKNRKAPLSETGAKSCGSVVDTPVARPNNSEPILRGISVDPQIESESQPRRQPDAPSISDNTNSSRRKSTGGILNNQKRKLVYNGGAKQRHSLGGRTKRLSFGGTSASSGAGRNLLGRKFMTPKRIVPLSNSTNGKPSSSCKKRGAMLGLGTSGSIKKVKPERIIQHHPSPIVPVWVGSFLNGDGLDGSIVGDLVMIMGEIVYEHCVDCQQNDGHFDYGPADTIEGEVSDDIPRPTTNDSNDAAPTVQAIAASSLINGVQGAARCIAVCASRGRQKPAESKHTKMRGRSFCCKCTRFLRARIVKNANGTDMSLQKETLKLRRDYLSQRQMQMPSLDAAYRIGCGPPPNTS